MEGQFLIFGLKGSPIPLKGRNLRLDGCSRTDSGKIYGITMIGSLCMGGLGSIAYGVFFHGSSFDVGFGIMFLLFGGFIYLKRWIRGWDETSFYYIFLSFFMGTLFWVIGAAAADFTASMLIMGDTVMMAAGFLTLAGHAGTAEQQRHPSQKWVFLFGSLIVGWGVIALGALTGTTEWFLFHAGVGWITCGGVIMGIAGADRTLAIEMEWDNVAIVLLGGGLALIFEFIGTNPLLIGFTLSTMGYWVVAVWFDKKSEKKPRFVPGTENTPTEISVTQKNS